MKAVVASDGTVTVTLSKSNLLALLQKVDNPDSAKTIVKYTNGVYLVVRAEPDLDHYKGEPRGVMTPEAEAFIKERS